MNLNRINCGIILIVKPILIFSICIILSSTVSLKSFAEETRNSLGSQNLVIDNSHKPKGLKCHTLLTGNNNLEAEVFYNETKAKSPVAEAVLRTSSDTADILSCINLKGRSDIIYGPKGQKLFIHKLWYCTTTFDPSKRSNVVFIFEDSTTGIKQAYAFQTWYSFDEKKVLQSKTWFEACSDVN